ncbi:MAG: protein tyrosine phosphatase family protein [Shewanella psychromarinicola]|uniref:protein tyrosine phosphatase family protein n=1 Tax=Shewanella psychromarinicola TaxID=2487742 RepID=UPI00300271B2
MNILQRYRLLSASLLISCFFFSAGVFSSGVNNADMNSTGSMANIDTNTLGDIKAVKFNNPQVITAGLPTEQQFAQLAQAGIKTVINLIPNDNPNALQNEQQIVTQLGMNYHNISVDWQQPTPENLQQFFSLMDQNGDAPVLVHCAANYRASAFYYLYQTRQNKAPTMAEALTPWGDLQQSFAEYPQWQQLIEDTKLQYQTKQ